MARIVSAWGTAGPRSGIEQPADKSRLTNSKAVLNLCKIAIPRSLCQSLRHDSFSCASGQPRGNGSLSTPGASRLMTCYPSSLASSQFASLAIGRSSLCFYDLGILDDVATNGRPLTRKSLLAAAPRTKLQFSISAVFALLILPALSAVIAFSYYENVRNLSEVAQRSIDRARDDAITMGSNFFEPVAATLRLVAEVASGHPEFFRTQDSRDTLYAALISAPQIDAVYTSFEDGYHRVVTRMDDDRRRNNPRIPALANWHSSYIDAYAAGEDRARHRRFFEQWPRVIGGFTEPTTFRVETLPHFKAARENLGIAITEPIINPDTGSPVISMAYPIRIHGKFGGAASREHYVERDVEISRYPQG